MHDAPDAVVELPSPVEAPTPPNPEAVAAIERGAFHWRDGVYFERTLDGDVRLTTSSLLDAVIPAPEWVSITDHLGTWPPALPSLGDGHWHVNPDLSDRELAEAKFHAAITGHETVRQWAILRGKGDRGAWATTVEQMRIDARDLVDRIANGEEPNEGESFVFAAAAIAVLVEAKAVV